jgi:hypothetical protein
MPIGTPSGALGVDCEKPPGKVLDVLQQALREFRAGE